MLQDIHPHRFDIAFKNRPPEDLDRIAVLDGDRMLLSGREGGDGGFLPPYRDLRPLLAGARADLRYLFSVDETGYYHCTAENLRLDGGEYVDFRDFRKFGDSWKAFAGATAGHLALWHRQNRFCGACGGPTEPKEDERALCCPACGIVVYPRISPAVIVGVVDGEKLLLTVYANREYRRHALVAGFMEVGETVEDAVRREVMEEAGVGVKNIRYYKSQPWAFSGSVLMGFFADLDGPPDITLDENELEDAAWFAREDIPPNESLMSLTATMIEAFRERRVPRGTP